MMVERDLRGPLTSKLREISPRWHRLGDCRRSIIFENNSNKKVDEWSCYWCLAPMGEPA